MDGNFNAGLEAPEGHVQDETIAADLSAAGLEDIVGNFFPQCKPWLRDIKTCIMLCRRLEVRSRTDYILDTDSCLLHNVMVRDAPHN